MTFIKKFESLKKKVSALNASDIEGKIAMQVNMVDEDCGGAFYIEAENGTLTVEPYDYNDRTVMLTLKAADFVALIDKKAALGDYVANGEVTVEGDYSHAEKIFNLKKTAAKKATKKAPAKKAAEKKEPAKTEKVSEKKATVKAEKTVEKKEPAKTEKAVEKKEAAKAEKKTAASTSKTSKTTKK